MASVWPKNLHIHQITFEAGKADRCRDCSITTAILLVAAFSSSLLIKSVKVTGSENTPILKVWGSIASTLKQQAKPLDCTATLVYSMPTR